MTRAHNDEDDMPSVLKRSAICLRRFKRYLSTYTEPQVFSLPSPLFTDNLWYLRADSTGRTEGLREHLFTTVTFRIILWYDRSRSITEQKFGSGLYVLDAAYL